MTSGSWPKSWIAMTVPTHPGLALPRVDVHRLGRVRSLR